jgi:lysine 2,3-aminomutase
MRLLEVETVRDARRATKVLAGLPQHWQSVIPLVAEAARTALEIGVWDVRNQGVLLRTVNATPQPLLGPLLRAAGEAKRHGSCVAARMLASAWVHQCGGYDRERGISYWTKNYRTGIKLDDPDALSRRYPYYHPESSRYPSRASAGGLNRP